MAGLYWGKKDQRLINGKTKQKTSNLVIYKNCTEGRRSVSTGRGQEPSLPSPFTQWNSIFPLSLRIAERERPSLLVTFGRGATGRSYNHKLVNFKKPI